MTPGSRSLCVASLLLSLPAIGAAQPIHLPYQKAAFANPSEWPYLQPQCQITPANVNAPGAVEELVPRQGHVHLEGKFPLFAELDAPVTVPMTLVLYHVDGHITDVWGPLITKLVWDATGTSTPPSLRGDPEGIVTFNVQVTFNPNQRGELPGGYPPPPLHGWFMLRVTTRTYFTQGGLIDCRTDVPYFSVLDRTVPEAPISDGIGVFRAFALPYTKNPAGDNAFGTNVVDIFGFLPVFAPINSVWTLDVRPYGYGGAHGMPPGTYEVRVDPDPHHGVPGRVIKSRSAIGQANDLLRLDPDEIGLGTHKIAIDWIQSGDGAPTLFAPGQTIWARQVFTLTVVDKSVTVPQPPTGPPPPPPPTMVTVPNVVGLTQAGATTSLAAGGVILGSVATAASPTVAAGLVISQAPAAGTMVARGSAVALVVSIGPAPPVDWTTIGSIPALPGTRPLLLQQFGTALQFRLCVSGTSPLQCLVWP